jgi:hypothetical protein
MSPVAIVSVVVALVFLAPVVAVVVGGAKVKATVECPAGEWTPIVKNFGTAMPRQIAVEIEGEDGVAGRWREVRQRRIFRDVSVAGELNTSLAFHRRWIDWRYRIEIRPDADVTAVVT